MTLCKYCIETLKEYGDIVIVESMEYTEDEAMENDIGCDRCGCTNENLYECAVS